MGWRYRKKIKICKGLSLNINKKSLGLSIGTKGIRYTINSKGKKTLSVGLPGSGLYYTKSNNQSNIKKTPTKITNNVTPQKNVSNMKPNIFFTKKIYKKWWFWTIIIITLLIGYSNDSSINSIDNNYNESSNYNSTSYTDIDKNKSIDTSNIVLPTTDSQENDTQFIYSDKYSEYLEEKIEKVVQNSNIFTNYALSSIGNDCYNIYFYTQQYYNLQTFKTNLEALISELSFELGEKEYKAKYFAPKNILLKVNFCGYGKNLNTQKIETTTHPLATFSIYTNELTKTEELYKKIEIYDYWF